MTNQTSERKQLWIETSDLDDSHNADEAQKAAIFEHERNQALAQVAFVPAWYPHDLDNEETEEDAELWSNLEPSDQQVWLWIPDAIRAEWMSLSAEERSLELDAARDRLQQSLKVPGQSVLATEDTWMYLPEAVRDNWSSLTDEQRSAQLKAVAMMVASAEESDGEMQAPTPSLVGSAGM
jgi:hypothetical protein